MNCPYCDLVLDTDFFPHCSNKENVIEHYYEFLNGNELIIFEDYLFYNGMPPNIRFNRKDCCLNSSFSIFKNKSIKEIIELFNKLKVFE